MTSRSDPDWLKTLIAEEGDSQLISAEEKAAVLDALGAAQAREQLDPQRHARLLAAALGLPQNGVPADEEASDDEQQAAAQLAQDLGSNSVAQLLRAAYSPQPISSSAESRIRIAALSATAKAPWHRNRVAARTFGGILAAAAAVSLWLATSGSPSVRDFGRDRSSPLNYAQSRSTEVLFTGQFAQTSASERIDRIAQARQKELRENRYLTWGVP